MGEHDFRLAERRYVRFAPFPTVALQFVDLSIRIVTNFDETNESRRFCQAF
jgi:hypothetical protein